MEKVEVEATVVGGEQTAHGRLLAQKDAQGQVKSSSGEEGRNDTETVLGMRSAELPLPRA
ncbi:MAG: hypothetical protein ACLT98_04805 [Eggerthellaceae bacterium]